jgi:hypothetical protein
MINNNPNLFLEQIVAHEDLNISGNNRSVRNDIGYDYVYLSSTNDFEWSLNGAGKGLRFTGGTTHRISVQSDWQRATFFSTVANQIVYVMYAEHHYNVQAGISTDSRAFANRVGFLNTNALTTGTFTRAATTNGAYYYNSVGLLTTAATNEPRFDYDPLTLASRGLLLEQTATQYVQKTEKFSEAVGVGITATDNTTETLSPTGQNNASKMTYTASGTSNYLIPVASSTGGTLQAGSVYVKKGNFTDFGFEINNWSITNGQFLRGVCNLDTGLITYTLGTGSTNRAEQLSNGWWRVGFSTSVGGVSTSIHNILLGTGTNRTIGDTCYLFGANLTNTPVVQSYIKNDSAGTVNRPADVYTISTSSFGFSTSLGTLYLSWDGNIFDGNANVSSRRPLTFLSPNEYFFINDTSGDPVWAGKSRDKDTNILFWNNPDPTNNRLQNRVLNTALSWNTQVGLYTGVINNGTAARATFTGFTTAGAHVYTFNAQAFQGHIREMRWFGFAFTDSQLGELTK